jgi:DNA-binding NtrC family response regulator
MKTVLIVTAEASLLGRLQRAFGNCTTFVARNDGEALKTLRSVEVDVVLRDTRGPVKNLPAFVTRAKELSPSALVVAVGAGEEEAEAADFSIPAAFTQRDLDAALRRLGDKQRLLRELAVLKTLARRCSACSRNSAGSSLPASICPVSWTCFSRHSASYSDPPAVRS